MIPNNNFYGKKHDKTMRDFTLGLDYTLNTTDERVEFLKDRLEIKEVGDIEFAHDFFVELFDQTFDTLLDKDGVYWVHEEDRYMNYNEFTSWARKNNVDIADYLDINTAFDELSEDEVKGSWDYSNINTSSVKLVLNSTDVQYSESNIAKELTKLADYILAKDDKKDKTRIRVYNETEFYKKVRNEKKKIDSLEAVNGGEFIVLKRVKNYRLAPDLEIHKSDYKLPSIYRGTYEDYIEHWENHQYKVVLSEGKYKKVYINKDNLDKISTSVCMSRYQWEKGKSNMLEKISMLEQADKNKKHLDGLKNNMRKGIFQEGIKLRHVTNNIKDINDYMKMLKKSYQNYVAITPEKCPANSNLMDIIDYSNPKHVLAIMKLNTNDDDLSNDMSIVVYDVNRAIEKSYNCGDLSDKEIEIINLLRKGVKYEDIAEKENVTSRAIFKRVEKMVRKVIKALNR